MAHTYSLLRPEVIYLAPSLDFFYEMIEQIWIITRAGDGWSTFQSRRNMGKESGEGLSHEPVREEWNVLRHMIIGKNA